MQQQLADPVHVIEDSHIPPEDKVIIDNIITALESLGSKEFPICQKYKIVQVPKGYMFCIRLPHQDAYELTLDDLLFIQSVNPTRIETISVGRCSKASQQVELFIRVLNSAQRIMVKSKVSFFEAIRKRKFEDINHHQGD